MSSSTMRAAARPARRRSSWWRVQHGQKDERQQEGRGRNRVDKLEDTLHVCHVHQFDGRVEAIVRQRPSEGEIEEQVTNPAHRLGRREAWIGSCRRSHCVQHETLQGKQIGNEGERREQEQDDESRRRKQEQEDHRSVEQAERAGPDANVQLVADPANYTGFNAERTSDCQSGGTGDVSFLRRLQYFLPDSRQHFFLFHENLPTGSGTLVHAQSVTRRGSFQECARAGSRMVTIASMSSRTRASWRDPAIWETPG